MVRAYYAHDTLVYEELPARRALQEIVRTKPLGRAWLIDLDKALIGYAVLTFGFSVEFHGRLAVFDEVFLLPDHRGKGHFKEILTLIETYCHQQGIRALSLVVETKNAQA
jgi:GNAT superfamily N-acetyltransferase